MPEHTSLSLLFYSVFLGQVLLISLYFPRKILRQVKYVTDTYPPAEYPKLYPVSIDVAERARRNFRNMNLIALLIGLVLVCIGIFSPSREMLNWDSDLVLTFYLLIQYSPMIIAASSGFTYFNAIRKDDPRTTRRADLRPRRLFDFVSPTVVGLAVFVYLAFVLLVLYLKQFDYPWFGGDWNILGVTVLNLFFAGIIAHNLYGKRKDPYQAYEDRIREMKFVVNIALFVSISGTLFLALTIVLATFDLRQLQPISFSLFCQFLAAMSFRAFRIDHVDFEVYRAEPLTA